MADFTLNGFFLILDILNERAEFKAGAGLDCAHRAGLREDTTLAESTKCNNALIADAEEQLQGAVEVERALQEFIRKVAHHVSVPVQAEIDKRCTAKPLIEKLAKLLVTEVKE